MADEGEIGGDMGGLMLTGISLAVPAVLSVIFYSLAKTSPGGIQPGKTELGRHDVGEEHQTSSDPADLIEEREVVPEELAEKIVSEASEQVVAEVPEEVEVPVMVEKKKKKKKWKILWQKEGTQDTMGLIEDVSKPMVEEPLLAVAPVEKKKKKKNKVSQPEQSPSEVLEETVVADENTLVTEEGEIQEELVQEQVVETEVAVLEEAIVEEDGEVANTIEETSPEKGRVKGHLSKLTNLLSNILSRSSELGEADATQSPQGDHEESSEREDASICSSDDLDIHDPNLLAHQDASFSWEWPLTRDEKKTRVSELERNIQLTDKQKLKEELEDLRRFRTQHAVAWRQYRRCRKSIG